MTTITTPDMIEEIEWLLSFNTHPDHISTSLKLSPGAIERRLDRAGRSDLAIYFRKSKRLDT